ncbi:bifunctional cis-abienol synthase, chloroplastic-like, partial [Phalaenopsis equestris]|uniref:bifunctional cis-abienol synthase, chloroplastic-like n=1 Tax=Phalaenopsis equestris TaxID=78828 RepID=UPI0009E53DEB
MPSRHAYLRVTTLPTYPLFRPLLSRHAHHRVTVLLAYPLFRPLSSQHAHLRVIALLAYPFFGTLLSRHAHLLGTALPTYPLFEPLSSRHDHLWVTALSTYPLFGPLPLWYAHSRVTSSSTYPFVWAPSGHCLTGIPSFRAPFVWAAAVTTCPPSGHCLTGVGALKVIQGGALDEKMKDLSPLKLNTYDQDEAEQEERINILVKEIKEMFSSIGDGELSTSPYDTAWVARIPSKNDPSKPHFPTTLEWVVKNQLEDGSWGEPIFFSLYDRLVCTLSCVITLTQWKQGHELIAKGLYFLQTRIKDLDGEKGVRTVGFEIIFPSMLNEAKVIGLNLPYDLPCIRHIIKLREEKMTRIPMEVLHSVPTTLLYSLEAIEADLVQWDRILKLQCRNGSISDSPSATAAAYLNTNDEKCLEYLTYIVKKFQDCAPSLYPVDTFERCWMIDTIQRLGIDHHFRKEIHITLEFVYRILRKDGLAWGSDASITDIDDTCMGLRLLRLHGYPISSDMLEYFKDDEGNFLCFMGETHKGISDFFSLYRFSQIAFPGENILKHAKKLAEQHLKSKMKGHQAFDKWAIKKALHKEVEWAIRNQWRMSLPRLEAQEYIRNYGENDVWIGKSLY